MQWILKLMFVWNFCMAYSEEDIAKRECLYKGHRVVLLSDRLQVDGKDLLVFDKVKQTWTVFEEHEEDSLTGLDTKHLLDHCEEIETGLNHKENSADLFIVGLVVSVLAVCFLIGIVLLSFKIAKRRGPVGGVLGSIIHYPPHHIIKGHNENGV